MRWQILDTLYNAEAYDFGHLDSYGHYIAEMGEEVYRVDLGGHLQFPAMDGAADVVFALDGYERALTIPAKVRIAQVACGTLVPRGFDAIVSSIPAMVHIYLERGENAIFQPLCFDSRSLVCSMTVERRDIPCLFVGTRGGNHERRERMLAALGSLITVAPPTFGGEYFRLLSRARSVFHCGAEWAIGSLNAMRVWESLGLGCTLIVDAAPEIDDNRRLFSWEHLQEYDSVDRAVELVRLQHEKPGYGAYGAKAAQRKILQQHTYVNRVPGLVALAKGLP